MVRYLRIAFLNSPEVLVTVSFGLGTHQNNETRQYNSVLTTFLLKEWQPSWPVVCLLKGKRLFQKYQWLRKTLREPWCATRTTMVVSTHDAVSFGFVSANFQVPRLVKLTKSAVANSKPSVNIEISNIGSSSRFGSYCANETSMLGDRALKGPFIQEPTFEWSLAEHPSCCLQCM